MGSVYEGGPQQPLVGAAGKEQIKRQMSMGKPKQVIEDFRNENSLDMPAADAVYTLLDSLGHTRRDVHETALESAIIAAQNQIQRETFSYDKHMEFLTKIRHYLDIPQLQHLPLLLLAKQPQFIPDDIFQSIRASPELYQKCNFSIKRQLWHHDHDLFRQHILPLINKYASDEGLTIMSRDISGGTTSGYTLKRRENGILMDIVNAIEGDLRLYMQTLGMVREQFIDTNDPTMGTLRLDLVMAMHNKGLSDITSDDICYGLAWPLDACITKQLMDSRRVTELQKYFDRIERDNAPYGEIALFLCSPYSRHILAQYILSLLMEIPLGSGFSQRTSEWKWPSLMLTMGLLAHNLTLQDEPDIPKINSKMTRKFFEGLQKYIEESRARISSAHDNNDGMRKRARLDVQDSPSSEAVVTMELSESKPTEEMITFLESKELARQVLYAFLIKCAQRLDFGMVNTWISAIGDMVPTILGGADKLTEGVIGVGVFQDSPVQPRIDMEYRINAFELDAFVQSLVSNINGNNNALAANLNSICGEMDKQQGDEVDGIGAPLVQLLIQTSKVRHTAHELTIAFLASSSQLLAADFNKIEHNDSGFVSSSYSIENKESAVYFVFQFAKYAARHFAVDEGRAFRLKELYNRLATASPQHAFKYRINLTNCPELSKFLTQ
ncbi:hypothetical protein H4R24_001826 [Coemansia sp. RSA 988]|nr:hypothetical protein H4R24_001826 [Coemansia sp. RSA 988]